MLGELLNIPTGTLIDMLFVILTGELTLTASDVAEIEQIQRELQNRGEGRFRTLNDENPLVADEGSASMQGSGASQMRLIGNAQSLAANRQLRTLQNDNDD